MTEYSFESACRDRSCEMKPAHWGALQFKQKILWSCKYFSQCESTTAPSASILSIRDLNITFHIFLLNSSCIEKSRKTSASSKISHTSEKMSRNLHECRNAIVKSHLGRQIVLGTGTTLDGFRFLLIKILQRIFLAARVEKINRQTVRSTCA